MPPNKLAEALFIDANNVREASRMRGRDRSRADYCQRGG